jgi:hypothetical protein
LPGLEDFNLDALLERNSDGTNQEILETYYRKWTTTILSTIVGTERTFKFRKKSTSSQSFSVDWNEDDYSILPRRKQLKHNLHQTTDTMKCADYCDFHSFGKRAAHYIQTDIRWMRKLKKHIGYKETGKKNQKLFIGTFLNQNWIDS